VQNGANDMQRGSQLLEILTRQLALLQRAKACRKKRRLG